MTTTIFDFQAVAALRQPATHTTTAIAGNEDVVVTRPEAGIYGTYRAEFDVNVPGPGIATQTERTMDDWVRFLRAVQGAYNTFLWKETLIDMWKTVPKGVTTGDDGFLGTSGGSSADYYALAHRYIDASTLLVYVDDVLQTLTTHYTLEDNLTDAPYVAFVSPPGIGLGVTVAYEFYLPVRFVADPDEGDWRRAGTSYRTSVSIVEDYSGAHRA